MFRLQRKMAINDYFSNYHCTVYIFFWGYIIVVLLSALDPGSSDTKRCGVYICVNSTL